MSKALNDDRLRRVLEVAYSVEGVVAARVWQSGKEIHVAVTPGPSRGPMHLVQQVEHAMTPLREPDESWQFGLLDARH